MESVSHMINLVLRTYLIFFFADNDTLCFIQSWLYELVHSSDDVTTSIALPSSTSVPLTLVVAIFHRMQTTAPRCLGLSPWLFVAIAL